MPLRVVDPCELEAGPGPHPAASPFDTRVSEALGLTAFELYQVELPAGAETVLHDHADDHVEDAYVVLRGDGEVVVDGAASPLRPGLMVAVAVPSSRQVRAGEGGLTFLAVCAAARSR